MAWLELLRDHEATVWTVLAIALVVGPPVFCKWMKQRNVTALRKAIIKTNDPDLAMRLAEKLIEAEAQRRRWYLFGRDRPPGQHRA